MNRLHPPILALAISLLLSCTPLRAAEEEPAATYSSVEERRIANAILQERDSLRKEREELDLRKKELKTLEEGVDKKLADIDSKLEELVTLQKKIDELLVAKNAADQKRIKDLGAIYDKMTPAKAAQALSGLEQQLAADLLAAMKTKAAARVLDELAKQKATDLSTTFSTPQLE